MSVVAYSLIQDDSIAVLRLPRDPGTMPEREILRFGIEAGSMRRRVFPR